MTNATKNRPTHKLFVVTKGAEGEKNKWEEVGAAWATKDGKGFNVTFKNPVSGSIVMRPATFKEKGEQPSE